MKISSFIRRLIILGIIAAAVSVFSYNSYFLYSTPIADITKLTTHMEDTKKGSDGKSLYPEKYYSQSITAVIKNGEYKGKTISLQNSYSQSQVYDLKYEKGDKLFIEKITRNEDGSLTGVITGAKRDFFVILSLCIMLALFFSIGGRKGIFTIISLAFNLVSFYFVMVLYFKGINILAMCIPMALIFTAMLLFFMYGNHIKTYLSLAATLLSVLFTTAVTAVTMLMGRQIDYDFMDFLIQPYHQTDANFIYLSQVLICSLGAVTDVVVTIIVTLDEIILNNSTITRVQIRTSCRNVGDQVVGTMISIMFFTNLAAGIPFFLLSMRNGIALSTVIKYNSFFEISRFLTGSIGILIAIPVSAAVAYIFYRKAGKITC